MRTRIFLLMIGVCLLLPMGAFGTLIEDNGYIGPGDPGYVGYVASLDTWWHDGGPPLGPTTGTKSCAARSRLTLSRTVASP